MPAKTFKVEKITGQAGATAQILGPGGKPSYKANECLLADLTANQAAGQTGIGQDNEILTEGMKVTCKARTGPKIFNIQTITGKVGTTAASIRGQGNETYTAGQCSKFDASGNVFGLDKTTPGKRIEAPKPGPGVNAVKTRVQCKGWGGQKTFYVETVTGLSGKKAIVMGPNGSPKYTASECTVLEGAPMEAIDAKGATFGENDTVTCTSGVGPLKKTKTFTVATVSGTPGQRASIRGTGNEDYKANQCEARLQTAVGEVELPANLSPNDAVNKIAATPGVKEVRITELDGKLLASASAPAAAGVRGGTQRGGQTLTERIYKLMVLFINSAEAAMGVVGVLAKSGLAAMGAKVVPTQVPVGSAPGDAAPGVPTGSQTAAAAAQAAAEAGAPVVDPAAQPGAVGAAEANAGAPGAPEANAEAPGAAEANAEAPGAAEANAEAPGATEANAAATANNGTAAPPPPANRNAAARAAAGIPSQQESWTGRRAPARTGNNGRGNLPLTPGNVGDNAKYVGPANVFETGRANPDGVPFSIKPGDYKGLQSEGKYFIYYDPFFQKRAANVIIKTGIDEKGAAKYGFYRVTGTDQQILDGIRAIRGRGTGDVYDDIINELQQQQVSQRAELLSQEATIGRLNEMLAGVSGETNERIRIQINQLRRQIATTTNRLEEIKKALEDFQAGKAAGVEKATTAAY
jgi:hypothetical protein